MSVFDRLFLMLAAVATITACYPVTDVTQANPPSALTTSTPVLSVLKQVSPPPPSPTGIISDPASSYPLEMTKELIGQWQTPYEGGGSVELKIFPDHTYSYYTPALQGVGLVEIDVPAMQRYGKWGIERRENWEEIWPEGSGDWTACCICTTPEDEYDGGGCNPYLLEGDKLTTIAFPVPILGDIVYPIEWTRTK